MRYKDGAPLKLYVVVDQDTGSPDPCISLKAAKSILKFNRRVSNSVYVLATYELKSVQQEKP